MYSALIVAAGVGSRIGLEINKVLHPIKGKPMIRYSVERFFEDKDCRQIIVVGKDEERSLFEDALQGLPYLFVVGGKTRQQSVLNGLKRVNTTYVMIHDGARPNLSQSIVQTIKQRLNHCNAVCVAIPISDSISLVKDNQIHLSIPRDESFFMQTPQAFLTKEIITAHQLAEERNQSFTDDASLYRLILNKPVMIVKGDEMNKKVTTIIDLKIMEEIL
jgi:2-C-methyl-D-erythritol 4-phosphate cytidylyltransferase